MNFTSKACNKFPIVACAVALCTFNIWNGFDAQYWRVQARNKCWASEVVAKNVDVVAERVVNGHDTSADDSSHEQWGTFAMNIATKWEITCVECVKLLETVSSNISLDYFPEKDLIVFFHPLKTGGTSLSFLLNETIGGVVPGSHASGHFGFEIFEETLRKEFGEDPLRNNAAALANWWRSKRVLYSHNQFRAYGRDINESKLGKTVTSWFPSGHPRQRFRMVTMVRDPVEVRASNFYESICGLGRWLRTSEKYVEELDLPWNGESACLGLTMEHITSIRLKEYRRVCATSHGGLGVSEQGCSTLLNDTTDPKPHCASITSLLNSSTYWGLLHDTTSHCTVPPTNMTSAADFEQGALEYLSGLDTDDGEMIWFGITERMEESMCLFHYQFRIPYVPTPRSRFKKCRPTHFWSDAEKQIVRHREKLDYTVYRVANAILDIRLAKMQTEIEIQLAKNETLKYLPPNCVNKMFSLQRNTLF